MTRKQKRLDDHLENTPATYKCYSSTSMNSDPTRSVSTEKKKKKLLCTRRAVFFFLGLFRFSSYTWYVVERVRRACRAQYDDMALHGLLCLLHDNVVLLCVVVW